MADYYTLFSFEILIKKGARTFAAVKKILEEGAARQHAALNDPAAAFDEARFDFNWHWDSDGALIVFSNEMGNVEDAAALAKTLIDQDLAPEPIIISWAETCSSARPDSFGGGAAIISKGKTRWFNARQMATDAWKALAARKRRHLARKAQKR